MGISIDASEFRLLAADITGAAAEVAAKAYSVVRKTTYDIERDAKVFAPVDTGNLRSGIHATVDGLEGEVAPSADYARYVELGTSRMAPQPYMRPAADRHEPGFVSAAEQLALEAFGG